MLRKPHPLEMSVYLAGALGCYLELQGVEGPALVKGYAVWPDVFARIFLGDWRNTLGCLFAGSISDVR